MSDEIEAAPMCFACGQDNPIGLKIRFHFDGEIRRAEDDVLVAECESSFMLEKS